MKLTVPFSAAISVDQSNYGTQLICSVRGSREVTGTAHTLHYSMLTTLGFSPPGICTSALSNFRCPSSQLPGLVGSGLDPNRRGLASFGQSPGLQPFSCTSPTPMSPISPCFYHEMPSPALSPSTTCNARTRLSLFLSFPQDITWLLQGSCCI